LAKKTQQKQPQHPHEMTRRQMSHHKQAQRRQRIIFFGGVSVIVAVIIIIAAGWFAGDYMPLHRTMIRVYDTKYSMRYLIDSVKTNMTNQDASAISSVESSTASAIVQNSLEKQIAAQLGVTISQDEADALLKANNVKINAASRDLAISQLLPEKLKSDYFSKQVPTSDNQTYLTALMCENQQTAKIVQQKLLNGDNITTLAPIYSVDYFSRTDNGDFGYHTKDMFKENQIPDVPVNYAFDPAVKVGAVSGPVADNVTYKQAGCWVIRVNSRPSSTTANITAILCTDNDTALMVKQRLEAGDNATTLATLFNQYTTAPTGEIIASVSDNTSDTPTFLSQEVHNFIFFDSNTQLGQVSDPFHDSYHWTKGGYWVIKIDDRQDNSIISDTDRQTLISVAYANWSGGLLSKATADIGEYLNDTTNKWASDRALSELQSSG
jgi:hypothetical protein